MIDFDKVNKFELHNGHMDGHTFKIDRSVIVVLPDIIYLPPMAHNTLGLVWNVIPYKGQSIYRLYEVDKNIARFAFGGYCP